MVESNQPNPWRFFHMGLELAVAALVLAGIGWLIDDRFGTGPWGMLTGAALGFIGGMYRFIIQAREALAQSAADTRRRDDDSNLT